MEKLKRRDFLRKSLAVSAAVVIPSALECLSYIGDDKADKTGVPSEALKYITWVHQVPKRNRVYISGWNDDGLWGHTCSLDTGEIRHSFHIDYRNVPFLKNDREHRTLAQLRAEGVSWREIHKLYKNGLASEVPPTFNNYV